MQPQPDPQPTPIVHPSNIVGSWQMTALGVVTGLATWWEGNQGQFPPVDAKGWITLVLGAAMAVLGGLLKNPGA